MGRSPCCSKVGLQRGPWSAAEDTLLINYIQKHGEGQWRSLPIKAGLLRCGKSCRLRWMNYLRPGIKRGDITPDEEDLIARLHSLLGNRWSLIAGRLPGRTDNEIKNYWNTHLLKKLRSSGLEPKLLQKCSTKCPKEKPKDAGIEPKTRKSSTKCAKEKVKYAGTEPKTRKCSKERTKPKVPDITGTGRKKQNNNVDDNANKTTQSIDTRTLHIPKPIRISSSFSRSNSLDSLASAASSGYAAEKDNMWRLFELDLANCGGFDQSSDEILDFLSIHDFPPHYSDSSGAVKMLEDVYDEYLQLL